MANAFKNSPVAGIGTSFSTVYTAPAATTSTVIGLSIANVHASSLITVDVVLTKAGSDFHLIKNAPIAPGGTLVVVGGDQKLVLQTSNLIKVKSSVAASADAIASVLEIT